MLSLDGKLTKESVSEVAVRLDRIEPGNEPLTVDLGGVTEIDSAGAALLSVFAKKMHTQGRSVMLSNVPPKIQRMLEMFPAPADRDAGPSAPPTLTERLEKTQREVSQLLLDYLSLWADATWFTVAGLFKGGIRWNQVVYEMAAMGSRALGVVGLIAFLVGGTMALQAAAQLRQFGANVFVADLIGISLTRELGPLMAAIVVAGRSGSAVAAEIGTMVITEEVDALKTMGLHPTRFLVVPKALAITFTQPLLTTFANMAGIFGGFLVAIMYLDVSPHAFLNRLENAMQLKDLITGLIKSIVFAQIIVTVGALCGFRTSGGADAVGRSTTTSVVAGIFTVIVADAVASLLFYFGD